MADPAKLSDVVKDIFRRDVRTVPARTLAVIRSNENSSEVLIKLIQLLVVAIWATLYMVSPRTDVGTAFSPVPYALAGYTVINMIGLVWALRRGLPDWAVYLSIFIDVAMLMVLIWSFHIQYRQPASFYLKAPTLLYIFIFIALRALRFQARFVIAAGIAAAVGWGSMTSYVVFADPDDPMITRDYVQYLTSNAVLIGAEVDKMIVIVLVTMIIALALKRARGLLISSVTEAAAVRDLSRFFDRPVAEQITDADEQVESGQGVRRDATILFIDIRGFTPMAARLDAAKVVSILSEYEKRIVPIVQRNGGTIDKFLGDGVMATFGAAASSDTHAADALRAIDEIMRECRYWLDIPELRRIHPDSLNAAAATGPVVFGAIGGENRLEFTTIGSAVNLAAKLEKHNKALASHALTDAATYELARKQGYTRLAPRTLADQEIDGVSERLDLVVLHS